MKATVLVTRGAFIALAFAGLAGCISVFPKESPEQLYRFGGDIPQVDRTSSSTGMFAVQLNPTSFDRAAAGDAILTITGDQAAYIKGSRWVSPASTLFDAAVARAFDASKGSARLIPRGEAARADYVMKLDVRTFEARYVDGPGSPPVVMVEVYADLTHTADRALAGEHIFKANIPADGNRAGAVARAFDKATVQVLGELVVWANNKGSD